MKTEKSKPSAMPTITSPLLHWPSRLPRTPSSAPNCFFRVYSGVLSSGDAVFNPVKGKRERVGRMVQMHSNAREEIKEVRAGDIAAAIGLKLATTGDTLCDAEECHYPRAYGVS